MRIKNLIITGFGPYATKQELNFEEGLSNKNMFVITGNTGAGKTTIFDAINFALYGETSGGEREGKSLRSDFADDSVKTEVELYFSLRGEEYYIKRSPKYNKPKKRGEGFTESNATAELKIKDKTITGVIDVTKHVEEILKITPEQFKQLVMIPQGEFKKLLTSDSDKKEVIFRKIFGTKIFSDIQQNIKNKSNLLEKSIKEVQRNRENKIRSFEVSEENQFLKSLIEAKDLNIDLLLESFKDEIDKDEIKSREVSKKIKEVDDKIIDITKRLVKSEAINKSLKNLEKYKLQLENLESKKDYFNEKNVKLEKAKSAVTVSNFEENYNEKNSSYRKIELNLKNSVENLSKYKQELIELEDKFKEEAKKDSVKDRIKIEIELKEKLKEKSLIYENTKKKLESLNNEYKNLKDFIDRNIDKRDKNIELIKEISKNLDIIKDLEKERTKLESELTKVEDKKNLVESLLENLNRYIIGKINHEKETNIYNNIDKNYKDAKEIYEILEDKFKKNQAGILAKNLSYGEECPVCGSTHHPKLASFSTDMINDDDVKRAKAKSETLYDEREKSYQTVFEINSKLNLLKEEVIEPNLKSVLDVEELINIDQIKISLLDKKEDIEKSLNDLSLNVKKLNKEIFTEDKKIKEKKTLEEENEKIIKEIEEKSSILFKIEGSITAQSLSLEQIEKEFSEKIKSVKELEKERLDLINLLKKLTDDYKKAELDFNNVKSKCDKEEGNVESLSLNLKESKKELEIALENFKNKVLGLGFKNHKDYSDSKLDQNKIEMLEKQINAFNTDLESSRRTFEISLKECESLSMVDISSIKEELDINNRRKEVLINKEKEIYLRLDKNNSILSDFRNYNKLIEKDEEEFKVIGKLARVIEGNNPRKISFERYVLAAYFEDIIQAANIRFKKMTSSRFELLRKKETGDKRKNQGLDLEVFDNYTNKSRDIKTLSGGECFKASLSMALGLSDVVQAHAGGIQLDTIFIDEGFGTLDPESLDLAIESLIDLQAEGRIVGIISHVQELKDRIDARLEVSSSNNGSRAKFLLR